MITGLRSDRLHRHRSFAVRRTLGLVCITVALSGWAPSAFAGGDEPRITYTEMRVSGRPAEFYKLGFSADDHLCGSALRLLNRPMPMRSGLRMPHDYAKIDTAFFLGTEANVKWEPKWLVLEDKTGGAGILDVASADIFNDGQQLRLFRFELGVGQGVIHSIFAASPQRILEHLFESDDRVDERRVVTLLSPVYKLKPYEFDFFPTFAKKELGTIEYPWAGVFADVVEVDGKFYVLVMSAVDKYRRNRVHLLEFFSHKNRRLVCEYHSEYLFIDE